MHICKYAKKYVTLQTIFTKLEILTNKLIQLWQKKRKFLQQKN